MHSTPTKPMTLAQHPSATVPFLENGDRLTRTEFERRYHTMPHVKKAELIEGIVYMSSPVRARSHGKPHAAIIGWLSAVWSITPGLELLDNATVRLEGENEPQPDALLRLEEWAGGRSRVSDDDYIEGPPELVVEVAASSVSYDLHDKLQMYRQNEVREYLVWRVLDRQFDWFVLENNEYSPLAKDADGIFRSRVFPGLWLAVDDLLAGNLAGVITVVNHGLASPEYQAFQQALMAKQPSDQ